MKKIFIILFVSALLCGCSGTFAPDKLLLEGETLYIADRAGRTVTAVDCGSQVDAEAQGGGSQAKLASVELSEPVTDMVISGGVLWCVTGGGNAGSLYGLDPATLEITAHRPLGVCLSAIAADKDGILWVTERYRGRLLRIDPAEAGLTTEAEGITAVEAGREPCDVFVSDSLVYVLNNLPSQAATDYPIAAAVHVFDRETAEKRQEIMLPNGSTDAFAIERGGQGAQGNLLYVTHLLSRYQLPTSQITRGWICTNALSVIDMKSGNVIATVLLDAVDKGAANPGAICCSDGNIYVALRGTDEVIEIDESGMVDRIADHKRAVAEGRQPADPANVVSFLHELRRYIKTDGRGLRDMVIYNGSPVVTSYFTGEVMGIEPGGFAFKEGSPLTRTAEGRGEMYFVDATISFQGWLSCVSCHPDGRTDGLNWDQLNDGLGNPKNTKSLLYSHQTPPVMVTGIRKDAYTAVRAGFKHIGFLAVDEKISRDVDAYLIAMEAVASPFAGEPAFDESAARGRELFDAQCASCHGGKYHTNMGQYEIAWNTTDRQNKTFDVQSLSELWRTAPYLYDGRAATLDHDDVLHFTSQPLSAAQRSDLVNYLLTL